jgi:hypothetical protein
MIITPLLLIVLTARNNKYVGYWCKYNELATIVVLLNDDISPETKKAIENKVTEYDNLTATNYYSKEDYKQTIGSEGEIYAAYVFSFSSHDSIGTYIEELKKLPGVKDASQSNAKSNMSLYELRSDNTYTFKDSDEASSKDIVEGKYKISKGIIKFTPNKGDKVRILYTKNDRLCEDTDCNIIYSSGTNNCSSLID